MKRITAKRYIITCAACGCLAEVSRTDALTCSPRCRVRLHRDPDRLVELTGMAKRMEITPFSILQAQAIVELRPDLGDRIRQGTLKLDDAQGEVGKAFNRRVMEICNG